MKVGADPEMTPRQEFRPVPYALSLVPGAKIIGAAQWNLNVETTHPSGGALRGEASAASGTNYGVVGVSGSPDGYGGYFYNNGGGVGVYGRGGKYGGYFDGNVRINQPEPTIVLHDTDGGGAKARIVFENTDQLVIQGEDDADESLGVYSTFSKNRDHDANIKVYGSATNTWGNYIGIAHDGTDGIIGTDVGDLLLNPAGNVGIGTAAPTHTFHVKTGDPVGLFESTGSHAYLRLYTKEGINRRVEFANRPGGRAAIWVSEAGDAFNVLRNGNVGIGTSKPNDKLEVAGGALRFGSGSYKAGGVETGRIFVDTGGTVSGFSNDAWIFEKSDGNTENPDSPIAFVTVGGDDVVRPRLVIQGKGNVGIGTTKPEAKLDVAGTLRTSDLEVVKQNWAYIDVRSSGEGTDAVLRLYDGNDFWSFHNDDSKSNALSVRFNNAEKIKVTSKGDLSVSGTKNFLIDHPLDPEHKELIHSTLEGPEAGVFYRGEAQLSNGEATVMLPDYFEALTRKEDRTVLLTPKFEGDEQVSMLAASEVKDGKFRVRMIDSKNPSQKFYWEVKAVRADVEILEVEGTKTLSQ
uniref:Uncharacterized protein n=1 Tax=uncultured Methanosarcinales archaeon TaxID=183757 RepID=A0A7H1KNE7_9EURY|nr:hypothetical protein EKMJPAOO_00011 [uncultured Methanosarcinales archaeon]